MSVPTEESAGAATIRTFRVGHACRTRFSGAYSHRVLDGIGHNMPQEAPEAFADAILEVGGAT
jgi:pimeloyl-ACP methyl ester carboxylesterase